MRDSSRKPTTAGTNDCNIGMCSISSVDRYTHAPIRTYTEGGELPGAARPSLTVHRAHVILYYCTKQKYDDESRKQRRPWCHRMTITGTRPKEKITKK